MANNKMLIDASHPEETRVAVVRGNRVEDFDFEAQARKQLRGNIYLAKVTRVEPSLQAAFVDYGGNRHGFLAFTEIHPDYYQIPVADRQALLAEEAAEAREMGDDGERPERGNRDRDNDREKDRDREKDGNGRRGRRRGRRGGRDARGTSADGLRADENASVTEDNGGFGDESDDIEEAETIEMAGVGDLDDDDSAGDETDDEGADGDSPRTMSAANTGDSISEPAPDSADDGNDDSSTAAESDAVDGAEKPKKKTRAPRKPKAEAAEKTAKPRKSRSKKVAATDDNEGKENSADDVQAASDAEVGSAAAETLAQEREEQEAPESSPEPGRGSESDRSSRGDRKQRNDHNNGSDDDDRGGSSQIEEEEHVESVGQEDALEELPYRRKLRRQYNIQEVVKRRQILLVQVVKEERGNKGAALTTYLSLAGRYCVLMPNTARGGGISRKITNTVDRKRLKEIAGDLEVPAGMGVILRTAGASRTKAEIRRDFEYLMRVWENVRTLTLQSTAPCLVHEEGSLIKRSIRDLYDKDTGEVLVQGEAGYREAKDFMRMLMPSHAKNVKLYSEDQSIFARNGVESQLDKLLSPQVTLRSGGYIVMNQTEALVSIDVNSGKSTREHSIEDTALQTNLEAADEIARQLRLRDLAGLVVIDFIDMEEKRNNRSVEKRLKDALKNDRARIQVGRISHFGLLEMSRQRIRASVMESTMEVCPHCLGLGHVRSQASIALHVFRAIEDHLRKNFRNDVIIRCPVAIALDLLNGKRAGLVGLEHRFGVQVIVQADSTLPGQNFVIERGAPATGTPAPQQVMAPMVEDADDDNYVEEVEDEVVEQVAEAPARVSVEEPSADDGDRSKRRKRRRRRGRRDGEEREMRDDSRGQEPGEADDDDAELEGEDESGTGNGQESSPTRGETAADGENGRGRRRRRGRRGRRDGEKPMSADSSQFEAPANEFTDDDDADEETVDRNGEGKAVTVVPSDEPDEVKSEKTEVVVESSDNDSSGSEAESEENLNRRNTRRPKGAASPSEAEPMKKVAEPEKTEAADAPRRKGWWSKAGGFF